MRRCYLAIDFGGSSGRVVAGSLEKGRLELEVVHRFENRQVRLGDTLYWDFPALFEDMKAGLKIASQQGWEVAGIGVDTWGVDFGLLDRKGRLLGNPVCYRDTRTAGAPEAVFAKMDHAAHYRKTGLQSMAINTMFQLYSMKSRQDPQLEAADRLLMMPDLFNYFLTGVARNEYTIASTSELLNARRRTWSGETIGQLGLPPHLFGDIVPPGTILGKLRPEIGQETGLGRVDVIAVASHDTASAASVVADTTGTTAFLSSGTWSLLGIEIDEPILTEEARLASFSNEGGACGRICFLQNITGLWILQRLMSKWLLSDEEYRYDVLIPQAKRARIETEIPVDDPRFMNPDDMEAAIAGYCREHGLRPPGSKGELVRCVLQSLASRYRRAVESLNRCLLRPVSRLNIIGGGSQNGLLNQLTADALGIPVVAGPVEATAIGNIMMQAMAKGEVRDLEEVKDIVSASWERDKFLPKLIIDN